MPGMGGKYRRGEGQAVTGEPRPRRRRRRGGLRGAPGGGGVMGGRRARGRGQRNAARRMKAKAGMGY